MSINLIDYYWETNQFKNLLKGGTRPVVDAIRGNEVFIHGMTEDDGTRWQLYLLPLKDKSAQYRMDVYDDQDNQVEIHHFIVGKGLDIQLLGANGKVKQCTSYTMNKQVLATDTYMAGGAEQNHRIAYTRDEAGQAIPKIETFYYPGTNERIRAHEIHYMEGKPQHEYYFDRAGKAITRALFYQQMKEGANVLNQEKVYDEAGKTKELIFYHPDGKTIKEHQYFAAEQKLRTVQYREDGSQHKVFSYRSGLLVHEAAYNEEGELTHEHLYKKGHVYASHGYYDGDREKVRFNTLYRVRREEDNEMWGKGDPANWSMIGYKSIYYDREGEIESIRDLVLEETPPHERPQDYNPYTVSSEWKFNKEGDSFWTDGRLTGYRGELYFRPEVEGGTLFFERLNQQGQFRASEPLEERWYDPEERIRERTAYYTNGNKKLEQHYELIERGDEEIRVPQLLRVFDRNDEERVIYECHYEQGMKAEEWYHAPHDPGVTSIHKVYEAGHLVQAEIEYHYGVTEVLTYQPDMVDGRIIPTLMRQQYFEGERELSSYEHTLKEGLYQYNMDAPVDFFTKRQDQATRRQRLFQGAANVMLAGLDSGITFDAIAGEQGYTGEIGMALAGSKRELQLAKQRLEKKYPDLDITFEKRKHLKDFPDVFVTKSVSPALPVEESDVLIIRRDYRERGYFQHYPHTEDISRGKDTDGKSMEAEHAQIDRELTKLLLDVHRYTQCDLRVEAQAPTWRGEPVMAVVAVSDKLPLIQMGMVQNAAEMTEADFIKPVLAAVETLLQRHFQGMGHIKVTESSDGMHDQIHVYDIRRSEERVKDGLSVEERKVCLIEHINGFLHPPRGQRRE